MELCNAPLGHVISVSDADTYAKSLVLCVCVLGVSVASWAVRCASRLYEERIERARANRKREKEERRNRKHGKQH